MMNLRTSLARRRQQDRLRRMRQQKYFPLRGEQLEDRRMLAAVTTIAPGVGTAAGALNDLLGLLPADVVGPIQPVRDILNVVDSSAIYVAFPGEINNVTLNSDLGNTFLLLGEDSNVSLIRGGLTFNRDLLDAFFPDITFGAKADGDAGPLIAFAGAGVNIEFSIKGEQIKAIFKNIFDITDARTIIVNPSALLDLIPELGNFVGVIDTILNFDLGSIIPEINIDPLIDIDLPFGLPDIVIPPEINIDIVEFLNDIGVPTSLRDLVDFFPGPVSEAVGILTDFVDFFTQDFISDKITIATLDGPDTIDLQNVTGLDVLVYAGPGDDTVRIGGSEGFLERLNRVYDLPFDQFTNRTPATTQIFGEAGRDTFILGPRFDALDLQIDGGDDNDVLRIEGTDKADVIRILAHPDGRLNEVQFLAPDPNGGVPTSEVQSITLPPNTTGGTFTLTFTNPSGTVETTAAIPFNAPATGAGSVQSALEALGSINPGDVAVSGPAGGPWSVLFTGAFANQNQFPLRADGSNLAQTSLQVLVQQTAIGDPTQGVNEVQRIVLPPNAVSSNPAESRFINGGTFTLTFDGETTVPLPFNATRAQVQLALEAFAGIAGDGITIDGSEINVTGAGSGPWFVEFLGPREFQSQPLITADGSLLTGGVNIAVTQTIAAIARVLQITLPAPLDGGNDPSPAGLSSVDHYAAGLGGTFILSYNNGSIADTTIPLPFDASAAAVQQALENLASIGTNRAMVSGPAGGPWDVTLTGIAAAAGQPLIISNPAQLTGGVKLRVTEMDATASNEVQRIPSPAAAGATGGTIRLTFNNGVVSRQTGPLPFDATVAEIQTALESLGSIGGPDNVLVSGVTGGPWDVTFLGTLSGAEQQQIAIDSSGLLTSAGAANVVSTDGAAAQNEIQTVTLPATNGGTFTLVFTPPGGGGTQTTGAIDFNASATGANSVQAALEGLAGINVGYVMVTGAAGGPWTIEFTAALGNQNIDPLGVDTTNLTSSVSLPATASEITSHVAGANEQQAISLQPAFNGGSFSLAFQGETTAPLPANATAAQVRGALESLATVRVGEINVTGGDGNWIVEFVGRKAGQNIASVISGNPTNLSGGFPASGTIAVAQTVAAVNEKQTLIFSHAPAGGNFLLRLPNSNHVGTLPHDATALQVQMALEAFPEIGSGNVTVAAIAGGFEVTFINNLAGTNVPNINPDPRNLRRNEPVFVEVSVEASLANDIQVVSVPSGVTGGDLTLTFQSILVDETTKGDAANNEVQRVSLPAGVTGGTFQLRLGNATTPPLAFDATAERIQTELRQLSSIGVGNVQVTFVAAGVWDIAFQGALGLTDVPLIVGLADQLTGPFTTVAIPVGSTSLTVQSALETLPSIGVGNVEVTGDPGGPWTVEFQGTLTSRSLALIVADGTGLTALGAGDPAIDTPVQGGNGADSVVSVKRFTTFRNVEQIVVDAGDGQDRIEVVGRLDLLQGLVVNGGDGSDVLTLISQDPTPEFLTLPFTAGGIVIGDSGMVVTMDGMRVEFSGIDAGIHFVASAGAPRPGVISLAGVDGGDELRLVGVSAGHATFARDAQTSLFLDNFAANTQVTLVLQQGDDNVSLALNGVTQFSPIIVNDGGPAGADSLRVEGTAGGDDFGYAPDANVTENGRITIGTVEVQFNGISEVSFLGLGGTDSLTVREPAVGSNDSILFFPALPNDGAFNFTVQNGGPETAQIFSPVSFTSIENITFDTGTGSDYFGYFFDNVPGVDSDVFAIGGNGVSTVGYADQVVTFLHDITDADILDVEIGSGVDTYDITPGQGVEIQVRGGFDFDVLNFQPVAIGVTIDIAGGVISQPGLGDVVYTSIERVNLLGNLPAHTLDITGKPDDRNLIYQPLTPEGGRFEVVGGSTEYRFEDFGGAVTASGTAAADDQVMVLGSNLPDRIAVDGVNRIIRSTNASNVALKPLQLADDIEALVIDAGGGDDTILVTPGLPPTGAALFIHVDGNTPNASDRLVIEDAGLGDLVLHREGPDRRSGSVTVGALPPVDYVNTERVDILPLDPVTGGTGTDGLGRLVVFDTDPFEHNESLPNRTDLPALYEVAVNPNIDPGAATGVFVNGPNLPGDEDWYRFDADRTATLRFELVFEPIGTLANGNPGLPGDGQLRIEVYDPSNNLISKFGGEGPSTHTVGVEGGMTYSLRVRGVTPEAINAYDIRVVSLDEIGPQVTDVFITDDPATLFNESTFDLFDPKPSQGPTPLVHSITIEIRDLVERFPGFLYGALDLGIAGAVGQYQVVGDHNGIVAISSIQVFNDPVVVGQIATGTIILNFATPLPDDRFTLTVLDNLVDPVGNQLDGESNASEPQGNPLFPSGDSVPRGNFVARFTVDSRAELGVWAGGSVYVDTNGNLVADPENKDNDNTNEDITYVLGFTTDNIFAGNFVAEADATADGFDKLAAYGRVAGAFRWLIDTDNNGVPNLVVGDPFAINGLPFAGNFDGRAENGDEVGLKDGTTWYLDTNHDFMVDRVISGDLVGFPIVGDFDGDGIDDLAAWADNTFVFDLSADGIDGLKDAEFTFGFPGTRERPVAADFDGDGIDDIGLWVPDRTGSVPGKGGEWYLFISAGTPITSRIVANPDATGGNVVDFTPYPFGPDLFARWGDEFALPVVGNFDPPLTQQAAPEYSFLSHTNPENKFDVNGDGTLSPVDALWIFNLLNSSANKSLGTIRVEVDAQQVHPGPYYDVSGDYQVSPLDALLVINELNRQSQFAAGEGASDELALIPHPLPAGLPTATPLVISKHSITTWASIDAPGRLPVPTILTRQPAVFPAAPSSREVDRYSAHSEPADATEEWQELLSEIAEDIAQAWGS